MDNPDPLASSSAPAPTAEKRNPFCDIPGCDCQNGPPVERCAECRAALPHHLAFCSRYERKPEAYAATLVVLAPSALSTAAREYLRCDDVGGNTPTAERALATQRARTVLRAILNAPSPAPTGAAAPTQPIDARVLRAHWLTGIECNHEQRTDVATCFCAVWRSAPLPSVGEAVDAWIAHVVEEAGK